MRERLGGGPTGRWRQACSRAPGWCWTPAPGKQMATGRGLRGTRGLQGQRFSLSWGPGSQPLIPDFHNHASFLTRGPFKLISIQEGMKAVNGNLARCLASRVGVEFSRRVPAGFGGGLLPVRTHAPLASPQVPAGRDLCLGDIITGGTPGSSRNVYLGVDLTLFPANGEMGDVGWPRQLRSGAPEAAVQALCQPGWGCIPRRLPGNPCQRFVSTWGEGLLIMLCLCGWPVPQGACPVQGQSPRG